MPAKKKTPRPTRRTAIVPRVVFQTLVAVSVVPAASAIAAGCSTSHPQDADAGRDAGLFGVADGAFSVAVDASLPPRDTGVFAVAADAPPPSDAAFSVAVPLDGFSVGAPAPDSGFSVAIAPIDAG
jgi:hypothetical protein